MTPEFPAASPGNWNELLRSAAEDGLSAAALPAYLLIGPDAASLPLLAAALSPSAHSVGSAANGMSFLLSADSMFVTVPLTAAGDKEACLPTQRWIATRADAPLNGIIWLFTSADARSGRDIAAACWKISLAACRRCGVELPLYAVVLGNDEIPGFSEFTSFLHEEEALDGIVGWAAESAGRDDDGWEAMSGFETMEENLRLWRDYRLSRAAMPPETDRDAAFLLPGRAGRAARRLAEIIADAAPSRSALPCATLRGVYLVGLPNRNNPEQTAQEQTAPEGGKAGEADDAAPGRAAFARGMFRERILPERWLASEPAERARLRSRWVRRLAVATALFLVAAVAARLVIEWGLRSMTDAPAAVLTEVNAYRRWLRGGAAGEAPMLTGFDPPPPIAFGSAPPVLPELPWLYREMLARCQPALENPSWAWRALFRIGAREASEGAALASWLAGPPVLALAEEQVAEPLGMALGRLTARAGMGARTTLTPEEFNFRHPPEDMLADWTGIGSGAIGNDVMEMDEDALFLDSDAWNEDARALGAWLRERRELLSGGLEFAEFPDRFSRKRLLDSYRLAADLAEKIYKPWPGDSGVAGYFASNPGVGADELWRGMSTSGLAGEGGWSLEELTAIADWLQHPPGAATPGALLAEWRRTADIWKDNPASPLFTTARSVWRRSALTGLLAWTTGLPDHEEDFNEPASALSHPAAPLPRIPLSVLSQAAFDPAANFRPEIWRTGIAARTVSILAEAPGALSELEAAGLLDSGTAAHLSRLRLEPARAALLAHARSYCDYWAVDMAMLANPANWIVSDDLADDEFAASSGRPASAEYAVPGMGWAEFQAAAARIDPRDLTRRMLSELTQRRIEALAAMTAVMAALEGGGDDGLKARVELTLASLAEDAKLFATPEYWRTAADAWRTWRGLGNDAGRALARMRRILSAPEQTGLMNTFFPVLAANYYTPEAGEAVRLNYWHGFVRTAVELLQAETRRERRRAQRNILLKADSFPWRRDASGAGAPATREEMRALLDSIGFGRKMDPEKQALLELPDDPELQSAVRELMGGLGLGADWLPPLNQRFNQRLLRLVSALDEVEAWETNGGIPLVILPRRLQSDPRHRFFRAFSMRQEARPEAANHNIPREWELPYEAVNARWAWRIPEQEQMRLRVSGSALFDFYNQTVPVPEARIGQARLGDGVWPVLSLLLGKDAAARPCPEVRVEGAEDGAGVWMARLPVRGLDAGQPIWWDFGFALPAAFGPDTPGGATLLDDWPTLAEWREAVGEWNEFVNDEPDLRIAPAGEKWKIRPDPAAALLFQAPERIPGIVPQVDPQCFVP